MAGPKVPTWNMFLSPARPPAWDGARGVRIVLVWVLDVQRNTFYCHTRSAAPAARARPEGRARCRHRPGPRVTSTSSTAASTSTRTPATPACGRSAPSIWDEAHQLWVVSRHADVSYVSLHADLFCSGQGVRPDPVGRPLAHRSRRRAPHPPAAPAQPGLLPPDDPGHGGTGPPGGDRGARPTSPPPARATSSTDIAVPVPLVVIAELMGLPIEDRVQARRLVRPDDGRRGPDRPRRPDVDRRRRGLQRVRGLRDRHGRGPPGRPSRGPARRPTTSSSILVGADEDGVLESSDELADDELTMFLVVLLVAGNETTRNAIGGGMWAFSQFPDQWERLRRPTRSSSPPWPTRSPAT